MSEYLTLGPTPCDETCHPNNGDSKMIRIELNAYKNQLLRVLELEFGDNLSVSVVRKSFPHDFGSYSEICVIYNPDNEEACHQAFWLESNLPECWDGEAEKELKENNYAPYIHVPSYTEVRRREDDVNWYDD